MAEAERVLLAPVYGEGRQVQFWYLEYDRASGAALLGYELVGLPDPDTRESLGETRYAFDEARPLVHPSVWELAQTQLAELRRQRHAEPHAAPDPAT